MIKRLPRSMNKRFKRLEKSSGLNYSLLIFKALEAGLPKIEQIVNSKKICSMDTKCTPRIKKGDVGERRQNVKELDNAVCDII